MHVLVTKHWSKSQKRNLWISDSIYIRTCLYGCESWCLTEQLYTKLRQFYAQCVRTMSYITLNQSRMHHISTKQIETELGLASMWTNTYEPTVNCDGLDSMSAACPLIVYPDVCSPLGYPIQETKGCPGDDLWQNNDQSTENLWYRSEALVRNGCHNRTSWHLRIKW